MPDWKRLGCQPKQLGQHLLSGPSKAVLDCAPRLLADASFADSNLTNGSSSAGLGVVHCAPEWRRGEASATNQSKGKCPDVQNIEHHDRFRLEAQRHGHIIREAFHGTSPLFYCLRCGAHAGCKRRLAQLCKGRPACDSGSGFRSRLLRGLHPRTGSAWRRERHRCFGAGPELCPLKAGNEERTCFLSLRGVLADCLIIAHEPVPDFSLKYF